MYLIFIRMKHLLAALFFVFVSAIQAQENGEQLHTCYNQWAKAFDARGANEVKDGWHEDVIISIRHKSTNDCFLGKVQVVNGKVTQIYIRFVDGKYDLFKPNFQSEKNNGPDGFSVSGGITRTMITMEEELINVIFQNHLKPKKKAYERAPLPSFDDL